MFKPGRILTSVACDTPRSINRGQVAGIEDRFVHTVRALAQLEQLLDAGDNGGHSRGMGTSAPWRTRLKNVFERQDAGTETPSKNSPHGSAQCVVREQSGCAHCIMFLCLLMKLRARRK